MLRTLVAAGIVTAIGLSAAQAQFGGLRGLLQGTGLTDEDFRIMGESAASLYTAESPEIGKVTRWTNPTTGASGRVGLTEHDGTCASVAHLFSAGGSTTEQIFRSRRCRNAEGKWVLALE